jgi:hypothetical protein
MPTKDRLVEGRSHWLASREGKAVAQRLRWIDPSAGITAVAEVQHRAWRY